MSYLVNIFRGFCMSLADSVPGVSGGTIAFILGFYDKFITSLNNLFFGKWNEKKESILFLIKIGIGWVIGIVLASLVLTSLFEKRIYEVSSLFLGLVIFSLPLIIKEEKSSLKGKYQNIIFTLTGIVIVCLITYFNPVSTDSTLNLSTLNIVLAIYVALCGMIAISAMVLPGISGSTLLLIFGLYIPIMNAIKETLTLNFTYIPALICFGIGIVLGILLVIKLIKYALEKHRSKTIYLILGLMLGSIYAIIMGPTTLEVPQSALSITTFSIIFFVIGGLIILGLEKVKDYVNKEDKSRQI